MRVLLLILLLTSSPVSAAHPKRSLLGSMFGPVSSGTSSSGTGGLLSTGTLGVVDSLGGTASSPTNLLSTGTLGVVDSLGGTASSPTNLLSTGTLGVVDSLGGTASSLADGITAGAGCENGVNVGLLAGVGSESGLGLSADIGDSNIVDAKITTDVGGPSVLSSDLGVNVGITSGLGVDLPAGVEGISSLATNLGGTDGLEIGPVDADLSGVIPDLGGTSGTGGTDCLPGGISGDVDSVVRTIVQSAMIPFQAAIIAGLQVLSMVSDIFIKQLGASLVIVLDLVVFLVTLLLSSTGLLKLGCGTSVTGLNLVTGVGLGLTPLAAGPGQIIP